MSVLHGHQTIEELEEQNEVARQELSLAQKRALIKRLEEHRGKGAWRFFSHNGLKSGINWQQLRYKVM